MFTKFPHELWDLLDSAAEGFILLRILKNIGFSEDGVCFESRDSMCRACHVSKNTWKTAIESLQEKQIIVVEKVANRPHMITLHENVAGVKIRTRNRIYLYRGSNLIPAKKGSKYDKDSQRDAEREPFKVVKRRVEAFQDARNAVQPARNDDPSDDE